MCAWGFFFPSLVPLEADLNNLNRCSRGCSWPETHKHILQRYFTHKPRISRHDSVMNYLRKVLIERGKSVQIEQLADETKLKPDIIVYEERRVSVVDVQIINDQFSLKIAHNNKININTGQYF